MTSPHPIRCRCGKLRGEIDWHTHTTRAVCYCRDCRAYAHFLGPPEGMLDPLGGTDIVIVPPQHVRLTGGTEHLACMSLSPKGVLRWYTACCRTPVANTPRDWKVSHLGFVHSALAARDTDLDAAFGPIRMRVNRQSARGAAPPNASMTFVADFARHLGRLLAARVNGRYRDNPFFDRATGAPRVAPVVITVEERAALQRLV